MARSRTKMTIALVSCSDGVVLLALANNEPLEGIQSTAGRC